MVEKRGDMKGKQTQQQEKSDRGTSFQGGGDLRLSREQQCKQSEGKRTIDKRVVVVMMMMLIAC